MAMSSYVEVAEGFPSTLACLKGQLRPGIADADYGSAVKQIFRETLVFHPAPVDESHFIFFTEPFAASEFHIA